MTIITTEQMLSALRQSVEERGADFVYSKGFNSEESCKYVSLDKNEDEVPACIAGYALGLIGVPLEVLRKMDVAGDFGNSDVIDAESTLRVLEEAGYEFEPFALAAIIEAQSEQDSDHSWGFALRAAEVAGR